MNRTKLFFILIVMVGILILPLVWFLGHANSEDLKTDLRSDWDSYTTTIAGMNSFTHEEGLFSFYYSNAYELRVNEDIYYLEELMSGVVAFQIFENQEELSFSDEDYACEWGVPSGETVSREVCYLQGTPLTIVADLALFPELSEKTERFELLTRAETLEWILDLHYPDHDFSKDAADCFADVSPDYPLSGYVCFAKEEGIVVGIGDSFYPENSVNLWGLLKILFLTFEVNDYDFYEPALDEDMFELMTPYHLGYELIAKSYYEGLFENRTGMDIWPNRNVYSDEAALIIQNFLDWQDGRVLKNYSGGDDFEVESWIYLIDPNRHYAFEVIDFDENDSVDDDDATYFVERGDDVDLYFEQQGGFYEYLYTFKEWDATDIEEIHLDYKEGRIRGEMEILFADGNRQIRELVIDEDEFLYLTEEAQNDLDNPNLLPNEVEAPSPGGIPHIDISLGHEDFERLFEERTVTTRYPAYLTLTYPDGTLLERSIVIKTRGNANRGYIKSSFTIETFTDFEENSQFEGDEFLSGSDEIKLRSLISDESMIKEKLLYDTFENLGYLSPDFFEATLSINGIPMGFYQPTEAIKDPFFERRSLDVDRYYYARNITSPFMANLTYPGDEDIIATHYDSKGKEDEELLIEFIHRLDANDPSLLDEIDVQNVFDYALLAFLMNAYDSLTHNFYVYVDEADGKWKIFFWDGDMAYESMPEVRKERFREFTQDTTIPYNNLVYFVFRNMDSWTFDTLWTDFMSRFEADIDLMGLSEDYRNDYEVYFLYDNALWNGKYLERKIPVFDTLGAISEVQTKIAGVEEALQGDSP